MKKKNIILFMAVVCLIITTACDNSKKKSDDNGLTIKKLLPSQTNIDFINEIHNEKDFNIFNYRNFYNGAGVAIGDINNDNLPDIYFAANLGKNALYLNKGDWKFEDITEKADVGGTKAWSTGVVFVDINADGNLDLYVCNAGNVKGDDQKNELFINNGDLTFTEKAAEYGLDEGGFTTHAAFFDYDLDGDLDCYILNNSFLPVNTLGYSNRRELRAKDWDLPEMFKGGGDKLLRNDDGNFSDVSEEAGIYGSLIGFGLGVNIGDVNQDLLPDIYVSNDFYERDYLYINKGDGTFSEEIKNQMQHISLSSMGADIADVNNDGLFDVFVTDMLPEGDQRLKTTTMFESYDIYQLKQSKDFYHQFMQNTLQINNGDNTFSEVANYSGVSSTDWSWGAIVMDFDNDGNKDIYVCNGIIHDLTDQDFMDFFANDLIQKMVLTGKKEEIETIINKMPSTPIPNYLFRNMGDLKFENYAEKWNMDKPSFSNGAAYGDLDNDGDLDLVVNNLNMEPFIYQNTIADKNNYVGIRLKGADKNIFGVGTIVKLFKDNQIFSDQLIPSRGFQSSVDYKLILGIGKNENIDSLVVIWPDMKKQVLQNVDANQTLTLDYKNAEQIKKPSKVKKESSYLTQTENPFDAHDENRHVDFDFEGLITHMTSKESPKLAIGDVNGDKLEDIYICGAKNQDGQLYLQNKAGKFSKKDQQTFDKDKMFEDTDATFFDADTDGDLDLYVTSGGNEGGKNKPYLLDRLYMNSGNGLFTKNTDALPKLFTNGSCVKSTDYDGDGDADLFVGSRSVTGVFGLSPDSYLLENDGKGVFRNVTQKKAEGLLELGMISDAGWVDVNNDQKPDLVIVGEYMTPTVFLNSGKKLEKAENTGLENYSGWWFSVSPADVNNDGMQDLVLGNMGVNTNYKVSAKKPMKLFINDFDNNGTIERICTHVVDGKDKPIHVKNELTSQLTQLKKQNLKFSEYAKRSINDLFDKELLDKAIVKEINYQKSSVAINKGNGQFEIIEFPDKIQLSTVSSAVPTDVNKDGNIDLILAGNFCQFKTQFGRLDASYGDVLLGDGKGNFTIADKKETGFFVKGEVRDMAMVNTPRGQLLIAVRNNDKPKTFMLNEK